MAYYELEISCERCGQKAIFVGMSGRRSAVAAAHSHGWYPAVGTFMWVCASCQKPTNKSTDGDLTTPLDNAGTRENARNR
jgi:DNA-directed RNA polymerase subunit RPC12/RpoP